MGHSGKGSDFKKIIVALSDRYPHLFTDKKNLDYITLGRTFDYSFNTHKNTPLRASGSEFFSHLIRTALFVAKIGGSIKQTRNALVHDVFDIPNKRRKLSPRDHLLHAFGKPVFPKGTAEELINHISALTGPKFYKGKFIYANDPQFQAIEKSDENFWKERIEEQKKLFETGPDTIIPKIGDGFDNNTEIRRLNPQRAKNTFFKAKSRLKFYQHLEEEDLCKNWNKEDIGVFKRGLKALESAFEKMQKSFVRRKLISQEHLEKEIPYYSPLKGME